MAIEALIIVDLQQNHSPDDRHLLADIEETAENAADILAAARRRGHRIVHIRHASPAAAGMSTGTGSEGAAIHPLAIHPLVRPRSNEAILAEDASSVLQNARLHRLLAEAKVDMVTIVGAMSSAYIEASTRTADDLGYRLRIIHDAVALYEPAFDDDAAPAPRHAGVLAALGAGNAELWSTARYLAGEGVKRRYAPIVDYGALTRIDVC